MFFSDKRNMEFLNIINNAADNRNSTPQNTTIHSHLQEKTIQKIIKKG